MMERTQIYLTREQRDWLKTVAARQKRSQSEIIREAIDCYLENELKADSAAEVLSKSFGIWADREDLDEFFAALRREADERIESWS